MAITVKDIQEKEFGYQKVNGYDIEQVDDFLDEIAAQMAEIVRENIALKTKADQLSDELAKARAAAEEKKDQPTAVNDDAYFKNLQSALRESLISSQRIADETTAEAQRKAEQTTAEAQSKAEQTVADAKAKAEAIAAAAQAELESVKAEQESVRKAVEEYRNGFRKLIEEQVQVYKNNSSLFD